MVIDSTVVIDILRRSDKARNYLQSADQPLVISRVVLMEIVAGCKDKMELKKTLKLVGSLKLELVEVSEEISRLGGELFQKYFHSHGLGITDALIAATAIHRGEKLATHNLKHFKFIKELDLIVPY